MKPCELLDGYLDDRLHAADRRDFESHLSECPACAEEVRLARKIDDLLASAPSASPPHLAAKFESEVAARRRRRRAAAAALAAGLLLAALGVWRFWPPERRHSTANDRPAIHGQDEVTFAARPSTLLKPPEKSASSEPLPTAEAESATVQAGPRAIALELPSDDPTVHVFWIYPATSVSTQTPENPLCSVPPERNPL